MSFLPCSLPAAEPAVFSHGDGVPYFYFMCNATTGTELNDATRLMCLDPECITLGLRFQVSALAFEAGADSCFILTTQAADVRDDSSRQLGAYVISREGAVLRGDLEVPFTARLYGNGPFKVSYPRPGMYELKLSRARNAFEILPVSSP